MKKTLTPLPTATKKKFNKQRFVKNAEKVAQIIKVEQQLAILDSLKELNENHCPQRFSY